MPIPFVGKRFSKANFENYLAELQFSSFNPNFVTLHHTWQPNLANRPNGLTPANLQALKDYYEGMGWSGGPHLFIDDQPEPIIVFQRLDRKGIHAVSFNAKSWGVEMLGNYDSEPISSGRGAKVRDNAMDAVALMCKRLGVGAETLKFHREDPKTSKTCPGLLVSKSDIVARLAKAMVASLPPEVSPPSSGQWKVQVGGQDFVPIHQRDSRPIARIRQFLDQVSPGGSFALLANQTTVRWKSSAGIIFDIPVAEIDENNASWAFIRDLAEVGGKTISFSGSTIILS